MSHSKLEIVKIRHSAGDKPGLLPPMNDLLPVLQFQQLQELQELSANLSLVGNWPQNLQSLFHQQNIKDHMFQRGLRPT